MLFPKPTGRLLPKRDAPSSSKPEIVRSSHPLQEAILFNQRGTDVIASPFKCATTPEEKVVRKVIEQNNYTTTSRDPKLESRVETLHARTASDSSSTTPSETEREIEHIENQFQGLQVNRLYQPKVTPTSLTKNWYPRPTPPDLQFEERTTQFTVSSGKLYEWNIYIA